MDFSKALELLKSGENLRSANWQAGKYITVEKIGKAVPIIYMVFGDKTEFMHSITHYDLFANDWEVL